MTAPTQAQIEAAREALQNISIGGNGEREWTLDEMRSYARYMLTALTAAAEVGSDITLCESTIERCAQVADEYAKRYDLDECLEVAAAIRALKDK